MNPNENSGPTPPPNNPGANQGQPQVVQPNVSAQPNTQQALPNATQPVQAFQQPQMQTPLPPTPKNNSKMLIAGIIGLVAVVVIGVAVAVLINAFSDDESALPQPNATPQSSLVDDVDFQQGSNTITKDGYSITLPGAYTVEAQQTSTEIVQEQFSVKLADYGAMLVVVVVEDSNPEFVRSAALSAVNRSINNTTSSPNEYTVIDIEKTEVTGSPYAHYAHVHLEKLGSFYFTTSAVLKNESATVTVRIVYPDLDSFEDNRSVAKEILNSLTVL